MTDVVPPEFSRPIALRQITGQPLVLEANEQERTGLARRLAITSVDRLVARVALDRQGERVGVTGTLKADITQPCAVTREELSYDVSEPLMLRFVPAGSVAEYAPDEEIELDSEDLDVIEYEGDAFDLGEAIAQSLALAIDPYREGEGADEAREKAGIVSDEDKAPSGPLADALAALKGNNG